MLCENCHSNEAEYKVAFKGVDGLEEKWLCPTCAQSDNVWSNDQQMQGNDDIEDTFVIKQILQHLAAKHGLEFDNIAFKEEKRCPTCGMTLKDIAHVGKVGCADCFGTFKDDIIDIVRRVQGGQVEHVGKTPQSSYKKLALKKKIEEKSSYLDKLIEEQNFEEAAIVRDEIKALKADSEVNRDEQQ